MAKPSMLNRRRFIQASAVVGATALVTEAKVATDGDYGASSSVVARDGEFCNWTGNIRSRPASMVRPSTLAELQAAVSAAVKVKAVGSGHSFTPCAHTNETMIQTDDLTEILAVDPVLLRVKVEAGKKLFELNDELAELGLAIPSLGDVVVQSLAGAISTGTHGTGMAWGSLSDGAFVHGMELVLADGTLLSLDADRPADLPLLQAARLGLGCLGIVYSITLNLVPAHNLERRSRLMTLAEALEPRRYLSNDHFEFFRFPFTDKVQGVTRNITTAPPQKQFLRSFFAKLVIENACLGTILNVASLRPNMVPRAMALLADLVPSEVQVDRSDLVMSSKRWVRAFEIEYAIPLDRAAEMQERYGAVVKAFAARRKDPYYANFPTECRFARGDLGNLLSPTQGHDSCWFSVASHISFAGYESFFRAVEVELLEVGGRPHWGKMFYRNPVELYPDFAAFAKVRQHLDPHGKFSNVYVERLLAGDEMKNDLSV